MTHARSFANQLRMDPNVTPGMIVRAADAIDLLMDIIESQRNVTPEPLSDDSIPAASYELANRHPRLVFYLDEWVHAARGAPAARCWALVEAYLLEHLK